MREVGATRGEEEAVRWMARGEMVRERGREREM